MRHTVLNLVLVGFTQPLPLAVETRLSPTSSSSLSESMGTRLPNIGLRLCYLNMPSGLKAAGNGPDYLTPVLHADHLDSNIKMVHAHERSELLAADGRTKVLSQRKTEVFRE